MAEQELLSGIESLTEKREALNDLVEVALKVTRYLTTN